MKYIHSRPAWYGAALIITDIVFFGLTDPNEVASIWLIAGFSLVIFNLYLMIYGMQKAAGLYVPWIAEQKNLRTGLVSAGGLMLALLSIGQLTVRDAVLIPLAAAVLTAYFSYRKPRSSTAGH